MKDTMKIRMKELLTKAVPDSEMLRYLSFMPRFETWRKRHRETYPEFPTRHEMYEYLNATLLADGPVGYLEFGVYKGDSMRRWTTANTHRDSRFWGFDTFTGLPEQWVCPTGTFEKGAYDAGGRTPDIGDDRVRFITGLFQHTLPSFLQSHDLPSRVVIHLDADIYSSTLYVLTRCDDIIIPGTVLIFDEFSSILNEFRAFEDYCAAYMREYTVVGATKSATQFYSQVAVQMR